MDSFGARSQFPQGSGIPGSQGVAWVIGAVLSAIAAVVAVVLALCLAASFVVIAVMGGALLFLATGATRARRTVKARSAKAAPGNQLLEARHLGGHSWVAYSWDRQA
jgi:hypothetical protein